MAAPAAALSRISADKKKQLKIKTGSCKRLLRELEMYVKETEEYQHKLEKLTSANADASDIKKQEGFLSESGKVLADTRPRLLTAYEDLKAILEEFDASAELQATEEYLEANKILAAAEKIVEK